MVRSQFGSQFGSVSRSSLLIFLLTAVYALPAQVLSLSAPEKIVSSLMDYRILGQNDLGVLVYKKHRDRDLIEVYDENMTLIRRKTLGDGMDRNTVGLVMLKDKVYQLFSFREHKKDYLAVQAMDGSLRNFGQILLLDSLDRREEWTDYYVRRANNQDYLLVYRSQIRSGDLMAVHAMSYDSDFRPMWREEIEFEPVDRRMVLSEAIITDEAAVIFVLERNDGRLRSDQNPMMSFHIREASNPTFSRYEFKGENNRKIRDAGYAWDAVNQKVQASGFFSQDNRAYARGVFALSFDLKARAFDKARFSPFDESLIKSLTGKVNRKRDEIPVYTVQNIIPRSDGGLFVAAEYVNESAEAYEYTDYDPQFGGYRTSTRYINYHEYEDVFIYMIEPDGSVSWDEVIRKNQVSREDFGKNSSYCLLNARQKLFFLFNEEISYETNIMQYSLDSKGKLERDAIFNAEAEGIMLLPRRAVQIAGNEIVIPSIYKNNLSFVKLSY